MKKTLAVMVIAIFMIVVVFQSRLYAEEKPLTNDSVISMVKVGLSDKAIISLIKESRTEFNRNPESLIQLKKDGVSNSIIEAMMLNYSQLGSVTGTQPFKSLIPSLVD